MSPSASPHALCLFLALTASVPRVAQAVGPAGGRQDFPAERLHLAPNRSGLLDALAGSVPAHLAWDVGLWAGAQGNPLVLNRLVNGARVAALVEYRVGGALVGTLGLFGWGELGLELPLVLAQGRPATSGFLEPGAPLPALQGIGVGDLRLTPKVSILKQADSGLDLAFAAGLTVPSGGGTSYLGDAGATASPLLAVSRSFGSVRLALNAGATLRSSAKLLDQEIGSELNARFAAGWRSGALELSAGVSGATSVAQPFAQANANAAEWGALAAWDLDAQIQLFAGGGSGLANGWGTPDWRGFAGVRFASAPPSSTPEPTPTTTPTAPVVQDADHDGIPEADDKCPAQPEDKDGFEDADGCPDLDDDQDGVPNDQDKCPAAAEDRDGFEDTDGCLDEDNDHDGLKDADDKCPGEAEDKDGFEDADGCLDADNDKDGTADTSELRAECIAQPGPVENRGCPDTDLDKDGVVDRLDNCPDKSGPATNQGCPVATKQLVAIRTGSIEILETVHFEPDREEVLAKSFPLLDNVAQVVLSHPEIDHVRIEGYSDDQGALEHNTELSDRRAKAVMAYLLKKGIAAGRLEAKGYGPARPIADNATKEGRARNRRVEFKVVTPDTSPTPKAEP